MMQPGREAPEPLRIQLNNSLANQIQAGRLPAECERAGTSASLTVRQALQNLTREGVIYSRKGTHVTAPKIDL